MRFFIHVFIHSRVLLWSAGHCEAPTTLSSLCFPLSWMHPTPSGRFPVLGQEEEHSQVRKRRTLWGIPRTATFIQPQGLSFILRFSVSRCKKVHFFCGMMVTRGGSWFSKCSSLAKWKVSNSGVAERLWCCDTISPARKPLCNPLGNGLGLVTWVLE